MASSIDKLHKFFKLEAERGYDNRAVVGGLDKILPSWEREAVEQKIDPELIESIREDLTRYRDLSPEDRAQVINGLLAQIPPLSAGAGNEAPARTRGGPRSGRQPSQRTPPPAPPSQPDTPAPEPASAGEEPAAPAPEYERRPAQRAALPSSRPEWQPEPPREQRPARTPRYPPNTQQPQIGLNAPLTVISGIGERHAQTLKSMGLSTLGDLLYYFPRRYDDYSKLKPINRLEYGDELTVIATVQSSSNRSLRGGQTQMTEVVVSDGTGFLRLSWFNQPWLASRLTTGTQVVLSGKVDMYLGRLVMNNPEWELLEQEHLHTNRITPVYPLTAHVTQRWLRRILFQTVSYWAGRVPDFLPESVRQATGLLPLPIALTHIHFPDSEESLHAARQRLAFDEILLLQLGVLRQKRGWEALPGRIFSVADEWLQQQQARLPYTLTDAQQRALTDLRADLASGRPMNRLLQGDVGSGKTVVAALTAAIVAQGGAQAAFMAPTGILAEQHYRNLTGLLSGPTEQTEALLRPEQICLLTGDTPEAERRQILEDLANGNIKILIGTHSLLEDPVAFQQLQLAVIDEQHRFGVAQRAILRSKGDNPHLLVMTATPIPRSLALTVYGDLDLTVMDQLPGGRQPIETHVFHPLERERAYHLLRAEIAKGHQAFIIYPLVEKGDRDEGKAAVDEHQRLQSQVFTNLKLGLLHGRMKPEEKDAVMARFRAGEYHVLVSTSVVEVGVDVPNATLMLIEGANRFGLAQLHQFRGRVGRGPEQSYCILIPEDENKLENERLAVMAETNDGFVLAERDLEQRGPGDFLGTRQAGFAELRMASLSDVHMIEKARQQAQQLFNIDPDLSDPQHQALEKMFTRFWGIGKGDIS